MQIQTTTIDLATYNKWHEVQTSNDVFAVKDYIDKNPDTPFKNQAVELFLSLRKKELCEMHRLRNQYNVEKFKMLIDTSIFESEMLINEGLMTGDSYEKFCYPPTLTDLQMHDSNTDCKPQDTDVFLFGIPATGKTCILMGLLNSPRLNYNSAIMGGDYAAGLQEYAEAGRVPPSTCAYFTTAINAWIIDKNGGKHSINLIEMEGQDFAFKIAKNAEHICSFENMESSVAKILRNKNPKSIFVILDPTADNRRDKRPIWGQDDYGNKKQTREFFVGWSQKQILHHFLQILQLSENKEIAKRIVSLNFIVTKADLLGDNIECAEKAKAFVLSQLGESIIAEVKTFCRHYGINGSAYYRPKCYTFSLGKFYLGNVFDYDPTDANTLIDVIAGCTPIIPKDYNNFSWWERWWKRLKNRITENLN